MQKGIKYTFMAALFGILMLGGVNLSESVKNRLDNITYPNQVNCSVDMSSKKTCHIYMADTIGNIPSQKNVIETLTRAGVRDEVILHMNGYGGRIDAMVQIINAIKNSKAETTVIVEGPVYSAHATISLAADNLVVGKYTYFMFHRSSAFKSNICAGVVGLDRGIPQKDKCKSFMKAHLWWVDEALIKDEEDFLTGQEMYAILNGDDVYVHAEEIKRRFDAAKKAKKKERLELSRMNQK